MDITKKFFHAIMPYKLGQGRKKQLEEELYKLECILKCGYILPYKEITKLYPNILRNRWAHNNGDDRVSICRHAWGHRDEEDEAYRRANRRKLMENAFDEFAYQETAIVLNESIAEDFKLITEGMYLEKQVEDPIPLTYMDAISIRPTVELKPYFQSSEIAEPNVYREYPGYFTIDYLIKVKELLTKYGYDVPIVSIKTGNVFYNQFENEEDNKQESHFKK